MGMYELEVGSLWQKSDTASLTATGVVCQNDMLAYGMISGSRLQALMFNNISVVGIDNIHFNEISFPQLQLLIHLPACCPARNTVIIRMDNHIDTNPSPNYET